MRPRGRKIVQCFPFNSPPSLLDCLLLLLSSSFFSPLQMLNERHVMVRVGGGWETFSSYLQKHDPCRGGGPAGRPEVCRDKAKPSQVWSGSPDGYMVVGAHYRAKK